MQHARYLLFEKQSGIARAQYTQANTEFALPCVNPYDEPTERYANLLARSGKN